MNEPYDRNPNDAIEILLRYHDGMAERDPCRPGECKFLRSIKCLRDALADRAAQQAEITRIECRIMDLEGALSPFAQKWRLYLAQQNTGSLGQPSDLRRAWRVMEETDK